MLIPSSAPKNAIPVARPPVNAFLPNSDGVTSVESPARSRRRSHHGEQREHRDPGGDHQVGPQRPAVLTALDQRVDQQHHRAGGDRGTREVERTDGFGRDSAGSTRAPARSASTPIGMLIRKIIRQPPPKRSASTSQPARIGPPTADRPMIGPNAPNARRDLVGREHLLDHAEALRQHHGAEQALEHAGDDQHLRRLRQRAGQRHQGEAGHAEHEHPAPAVDVAEPSADQQADWPSRSCSPRRATGSGSRRRPGRGTIVGPAMVVISASRRSITSAARITKSAGQRRAYATERRGGGVGGGHRFPRFEQCS